MQERIFAVNVSNTPSLRSARHCVSRPLLPLKARLQAIALTLALSLVIPLTAYAGPGHDHGEAPPTAASTALPRFTAASDVFELVGILNGKQLTLYLDHADTNAPVKNAKLDVEFGGAKLALEPHGEGEFIATLAEAPKPGVIPVAATVATEKDSDLLAGELDLHDEHAAAPAAHGHDWKEWLPWGLGGLILVVLARVIARRRRGSRLAPAGEAA